MKKFFLGLFIVNALTNVAFAETIQPIQNVSKIVNLQNILTKQELDDVSSIDDVEGHKSYSLKYLLKVLKERQKNELVQKINSAVQAQRDTAFNNDNQSKPTILVEGDSWLANYGFSLDGGKDNTNSNDFVDLYDQMISKFKIKSLASPHESLAQIVSQKDYMKTLKEMSDNGNKPQIFIISAGLDDIVGEDFGQYAYEYDKTPIDSFKDVTYLLPSFYTKLEEMKKQYLTLISDIRSMEEYKDLPIIINSYDYGMYPLLQDDEWVAKPLLKKGYVDPVKQRFAYIEFNEMFNISLYDFFDKAKHKYVYHLNARGSVPRNSWQDSIHPSAIGYQSLKPKLEIVLQQAQEKK